MALARNSSRGPGWQGIACGNTNTCTETVTVVDTKPPTLVCSTNKTVVCGTPWTFDPPLATDNCCSNPVVTVMSTITNGLCRAGHHPNVACFRLLQ
jgi:hypothetical protein